MKTFKSVIMVKYPQAVVWNAIRDQLPEMVPFLNDVASITQENRTEKADGVLQLVNTWKADIKIPNLLKSVIDPDKLSWTDRAEWIEHRRECHWSIEPHFFTEYTRCSGSTQYAPAIGGRGTRITFEGQFEVNAGNIPGIPAFMEETATKTIESLITSLIPQNFRKVTDALSTLLEENR